MRISSFLLTSVLSISIASSGLVAKAQDSTPTASTTTQVAVQKEPEPVTLNGWEAQEYRKWRNDWQQLGRYREANLNLAPPADGEQRVVFMGDSITDNWTNFFPGRPYVNRGISGQTTPQMLVRFRSDVLVLKPKVVVILAGTNDIARNTGPETMEEIQGYIQSMVELALVNGVKPVLASVLPVAEYPWSPGREPVPKIRALNSWIKQYCAQKRLVFLDYYSAMADENGAMKPGLAYDGVHPTPEGYAVMAPLAEAAIEKALRANTGTRRAPVTRKPKA